MTTIDFSTQARRERPDGHMVVQENVRELSALFTKGTADGQVPVWDSVSGRWEAAAFAPSMLDQEGAATGDALVWNGSMWAPGSVTPALVTSLPGSPADGDECILVDSTSAPTYAWRMRYVDAIGTNPWIFLGGFAKVVEVATNENTTSATYTDLTTSGPSFTTPEPGDWDITSSYTGASAHDGLMSYAIGGTAAADSWAFGTFSTVGAHTTPFGEKTYRHAGIADATTITAKYRRQDVANPNFVRRILRFQPVALGG